VRQTAPWCPSAPVAPRVLISHSIIRRVPPLNPVSRIRQVAADLGELASELDEAVGPDARRALLHWREELLGAVEDLEAAHVGDAGTPPTPGR